MPDIQIQREHQLGLAQARKLAFKWAETAEEKLDMEFTYEEGKTADLVTFTRSGVNGELRVTKDRFDLNARLGFILGAFKERIETEISLGTFDYQKTFGKPLPKAKTDAPEANEGAFTTSVTVESSTRFM